MSIYYTDDDTYAYIDDTYYTLHIRMCLIAPNPYRRRVYRQALYTLGNAILRRGGIDANTDILISYIDRYEIPPNTSITSSTYIDIISKYDIPDERTLREYICKACYVTSQIAISIADHHTITLNKIMTACTILN